jgi:uncharacterized coiled-coil protein SlyX
MTPTRGTPETGVDPRAIHRTLTGLRDRLRLQEDELDRLRERVELPATANNLLPQVRALETQVAEQATMIREAFEAMGRTETNVRRLIAQVDRLLEQVSRRPIDVTSETTGALPAPRMERTRMFTAVEDLDEYEDSEAPRFRWKFPLAILVLLAAILAAVRYWFLSDSAH